MRPWLFDMLVHALKCCVSVTFMPSKGLPDSSWVTLNQGCYSGNGSILCGWVRNAEQPDQRRTGPCPAEVPTVIADCLTRVANVEFSLGLSHCRTHTVPYTCWVPI